MDIEGVERLGLDDLEILELSSADREVGKILAVADLIGHVDLDPLDDGRADHPARIGDKGRRRTT